MRAAGAVRDSVRVPAGGGAFRLRYQPKTAGLAVYELLLRRAGRALALQLLSAALAAQDGLPPDQLVLGAIPAGLLGEGEPFARAADSTGPVHSVSAEDKAGPADPGR